MRETAQALLELVDAGTPPLRILFGRGFYPSVQKTYADRLQNRVDWQDLSAEAQGVLEQAVKDAWATPSGAGSRSPSPAGRVGGSWMIHQSKVRLLADRPWRGARPWWSAVSMQLSSDRRVEVPAGEGRRVTVRAGEVVRVVTEEGGQVGDLFAVVSDEPAEWLSPAHTRGQLSRLFPPVGEAFVTDRRRPILTLADDASPGRHDMLLPACDPARYRTLGVTGWHASCAENLRTAMRGTGIDVGVVPQPVNLFMDIPLTPDGRLLWRASPAGPGAAVSLRAELDCVVVVSACPQDLSGVNAGGPGPLVLELLP